MKLINLIIIFLLLNGILLSQEKKESYFRCVFLSVKAGYHTGFDLNYDRGFPDGIVYDGSIALGISDNILLGINFDYWKKDNVVTHPNLSTIEITKNFRGSGYKVYVQLRKTFFNSLNIYADVGIGRYSVYYEYYSDPFKNADDNSYLMAGISLGAGIKVNKFLMFSGEASWYGMTTVMEGGVSTINFKFGPTFYLQLQ